MQVKGDFRGPQNASFYKQYGFWPFSDKEADTTPVSEDKFATMPVAEKIQYAMKMYQFYWDQLQNKPVPTLDEFISQVYWDDWGKVQLRNDSEVGLASTGELVARWMNISYNSWEKLSGLMNKLAQKTPGNTIPERKVFAQLLADSAREITPSDFVKIVGISVKSAAEDVTKTAAIVAGGYATYKLAAIGISLLTLIVLMMSRKGANT